MQLLGHIRQFPGITLLFIIFSVLNTLCVAMKYVREDMSCHLSNQPEIQANFRKMFHVSCCYHEP